MLLRPCTAQFLHRSPAVAACLSASVAPADTASIVQAGVSPRSRAALDQLEQLLSSCVAGGGFQSAPGSAVGSASGSQTGSATASARSLGAVARLDNHDGVCQCVEDDHSVEDEPVDENEELDEDGSPRGFIAGRLDFSDATSFLDETTIDEAAADQTCDLTHGDPLYRTHVETTGGTDGPLPAASLLDSPSASSASSASLSGSAASAPGSPKEADEVLTGAARERRGLLPHRPLAHAAAFSAAPRAACYAPHALAHAPAQAPAVNRALNVYASAESSADSSADSSPDAAVSACAHRPLLNGLGLGGAGGSTGGRPRGGPRARAAHRRLQQRSGNAFTALAATAEAQPSPQSSSLSSSSSSSLSSSTSSTPSSLSPVPSSLPPPSTAEPAVSGVASTSSASTDTIERPTESRAATRALAATAASLFTSPFAARAPPQQQQQHQHQHQHQHQQFRPDHQTTAAAASVPGGAGLRNSGVVSGDVNGVVTGATRSAAIEALSPPTSAPPPSQRLVDLGSAANGVSGLPTSSWNLGSTSGSEEDYSAQCHRSSEAAAPAAAPLRPGTGEWGGCVDAGCAPEGSAAGSSASDSTSDISASAAVWRRPAGSRPAGFSSPSLVRPVALAFPDAAASLFA